MKNQLILLLVLIQVITITNLTAQNIAVNATGNLPDTSAMLDVTSTNKGFLAPRMTTTQQNAIPLPAKGLLIFNTTDNAFRVNTGSTSSPVWTLLGAGNGNGTVTSVAALTIGTTGTNILSSVATETTTPVITLNIPTASATNRGALSFTDWSTFNSKQAAISLTTTGTSGAATLIGSTLNIPSYTSNTGTVTSASIVSANGFAGTVATATTTPAITLRTTITGLLRGNGTAISAATADTDFLTPTGSAANLTNFPIFNQNTTGSAATFTTGRTIGITGDLTYTSPAFNGSANVTAAGTLATVNSDVGSFTNANVTVNAKGLVTAVSNGSSSDAWNLTGNTVTAGSHFLGSTNNESLRLITDNTERMVVDNVGNVGIGITDPGTQLVVKDNIEIRRVGSISQLLFSNTSGSGDFRIGGDGGDIYWQGGGGRCLQMGSYWATILGGDRQTTVFPDFAGPITGTGVLVVAQRDESVALGIQGTSNQYANLTEWRDVNSDATSVINKDGKLGLGISTPTAMLHLSAGSTSANAAPLKFTSGTNLSTVENGSVEYDGTNYFASSNSTRFTIAKILNGSASLDFLNTPTLNSRDLTITVTGAQNEDPVSLGIPTAAISNNCTYTAFVSSANTVTVRFNNYSSASIDPSSGIFKVSVTKY